MFDDYLDDDHAPDTSALHDVERIAALMEDAARDGRSVSYSELLGLLGFRFSRPKMRAVCKTLAAVDARALARGEPELAVLLVRESDRLPGQGWWVDRRDWQGQWTGAEARRFVDAIQRKTFNYWQKR